MTSPLYLAVMVIEPCMLDDAVYVTLHTPDCKLQEDELNIPPVLPSSQVMVPVGIFCDTDVSVTVAVIVTCPPDDVVGEDDVTKTDEVSRVPCDNCDVP